MKTIAYNVIKGTNIWALMIASSDQIGLIDFDRCVVYHGQDSNLYFFFSAGGLVSA